MTHHLSAAVSFLPTHERWFVESRAAGDWSFFLSPLPLTLTAAVVAVTLAWRLVALRLDRPDLPWLAPLGRLVPWVPRLLGVHLGVALLALAATGAFITPSNDHLEGLGGTVLLLVEGALGVWLVSGYRLRPAAALVLGLGPALVRTRTAPSTRPASSCAWPCSCCASAWERP